MEGVLAPAAREFVLLRITRMRGVNLDLFDFDYDLTWMGFFLNSDEEIYGRYGGREAPSPDGLNSVKGLRLAMEVALRSHKTRKPGIAANRRSVRTVEHFTSARSLRPTACVHCHQIYELRRQDLQAAGKWRLDELWVYPFPENVGLTLDKDGGNRIARVESNSSAERLGLRKDDRLMRFNDISIASFGDLQYVLQRAPSAGRIGVVWERNGKSHQGDLELPQGWRKTDISWRWSLRSLDPAPGVYGEDLTVEEKQNLGLGPRRLAFRQGSFVSPMAARAGIRQDDVIVGVDSKELEMNARQFGVYVRLNYKVGDRVTYNIFRGKERMAVSLILAGHGNGK